MKPLLVLVAVVVLAGCNGATVTDDTSDTSPSVTASARQPTRESPTPSEVRSRQIALEDVVIDALPAWGEAARADGRGYVAFGRAVDDLAYFTGAIDLEASDLMAAMFDDEGFVDEYYRRWQLADAGRPTLIVIEVFRFRDAAAAQDVTEVVRELMTTNAVAANSEAWQVTLAGGAADLSFGSHSLEAVPDATVLEVQVVDAERAVTRGFTFQHVAFNRGPLLTAITFAYPPELDNDEGRSRLGELTKLQLDGVVQALDGA